MAKEQMQAKAKGLWSHLKADAEAQEQFAEGAKERIPTILRCAKIGSGNRIRIRLMDDSFTKKCQLFIPAQFLGNRNRALPLIFAPSLESRVLQLKLPNGDPVASVIGYKAGMFTTQVSAVWRIPIIRWEFSTGPDGKAVTTAVPHCLEGPRKIKEALNSFILSSQDAAVPEETRESSPVYLSLEEPGCDISIHSIAKGKTGDGPPEYQVEKHEKSVRMTKDHIAVFKASIEAVEAAWLEQMTLDQMNAAIHGENAPAVSAAAPVSTFDVEETKGASVQIGVDDDEYNPFANE